MSGFTASLGEDTAVGELRGHRIDPNTAITALGGESEGDLDE